MRKLLLPFGLLYGLVMAVRNFMYDSGILKSYTFDIPVIAVGNLSVGGTGKTPLVEYLIRLLSPDYKVAVLSRGYRRKSTGFIMADEKASAALIGDEPFQYHKKFNDIAVAVDESRKHGIDKLIALYNPDVILLDDAFQHRKVKAGFYILLTTYDSLYTDDLILPAGNLRESNSGAARANVIVVTKCPPDLSDARQSEIINKLKPLNNQKVFFSAIGYDDSVHSQRGMLPVTEIRNEKKALIAGIAKPKPFFDHLDSTTDIILEYPDHHDFSDKDISEISSKSEGLPIVTTEKDFVRLQGRFPDDRIYFLPILSVFVSGKKKFDDMILKFVKGQNSVDKLKN